MKRNKRSTVLGAALIFVGLWVGALIGNQVSQSGGFDFIKQPQTGISKPGHSTGGALPVGPVKPMGITFSALDMKKVNVRYAQDFAHKPDLQKLVMQALDWNLTGQEPTVLILHTHASESYSKMPGQDYKESSDYRTLDTQYNMVAVGDALAALLEQAGICVLHDRQIHDYPSYNSAYDNSRLSAQEYLQRYPTIQVVLDLHRDAVLLSDGSQYAPTIEVNGKEVAQLMIVVGSNASGMEHPQWQENLSAALKLQIMLENAAPGITRSTILRPQRYNQDLSTGALILEIGAAGNTLEQAMGAVPILAEALIGLKNGTVENS